MGILGWGGIQDPQLRDRLCAGSGRPAPGGTTNRGWRGWSGGLVSAICPKCSRRVSVSKYGTIKPHQGR